MYISIVCDGGHDDGGHDVYISIMYYDVLRSIIYIYIFMSITYNTNYTHT